MNFAGMVGIVPLNEAKWGWMVLVDWMLMRRLPELLAMWTQSWLSLHVAGKTQATEVGTVKCHYSTRTSYHTRDLTECMWIVRHALKAAEG